MSTDPKIDQVLEILREEKEKNETRFSELKASDLDLRSSLKSLTDVVRSEAERNDSRFFELKDSIKDLRTELKQDISGLKQDVNKVYTSLSEDIQVFGEEQGQLKRRVDKIERKIA